MSKLLSAEFSRLWKNKLFWACMIFNVWFSLMMCIDRSQAKLMYAQEISLDSIFYTNTTVAIFIIPVFSALFIGTEYSNGTIRNKFIFGHSKLTIYFSNLIVCFTANIMIDLAAIFIYIVIGMPLLGFFEMPIGTTLYLILCTFLAILALTSVVTAISMLCQNKSTSAVASIVICFVLLITTSIIDENLHEPETQVSGMVDSAGEFYLSEPTPNPRYISGTERTVFEFLDDFLPSGQIIQVSNLDIERSARWWYFSLILTIASIGIGFSLFRRKDIR